MFFSETMTEFLLLGLVLFMPLFAIFMILSIFFVFNFFIDMIIYRDILHFTRNGLFKNWLKESSYKSIEGLLDALLASKKEDWKIEGQYLVYKMDDIYSVRFSNGSTKNIAFYYKLVETSYLTLTGKRLSFYSFKEKPNQNLSKELFHHLESIHTTLRREKEILEKEEEVKRSKEAENQKQKELRKEKVKMLKSILTYKEQSSLSKNHSFNQGSFKIVFSNFENYQECLFYYEDKVYVEATNNKQKQNLTFDFKDHKDLNMEIFKLAEREILTYVQNLFKESETTQEEQENEMVSL